MFPPQWFPGQWFPGQWFPGTGTGVLIVSPLGVLRGGHLVDPVYPL